MQWLIKENTKRDVTALTKTELMSGSQQVTNRAFITGMFTDAVKEIARVRHSFFCYGSTSVIVPVGDIQA